MKHSTKIVLSVFALSLFVFVATVSAADLTERLNSDVDSADLSPEMKTFVKDNLVPLCTDPVFVAEVTAHNAKNLSLDAIKATDTEWTEAEDELDIHTELLGNACAKRIKEISSDLSAVGETFVMGNKGANVGQNELTSDYWQGDEPKWADSFKDGEGTVAVSKAKLDKSTGKVDQKISLPIVNDSGETIGVVCFGVNPDQL